MKTVALFTLLLITAVLSCGSTPPEKLSGGNRMVIGVSPFLDKGIKDEVYRAIVRLVVEELPLGTSLWIYDAYNLRTITQVEIPNVRAFQSSKTRANQFSRPIGELKEFLAREHEKPVAPRLTLNEAVRFPQLMDFIASNLFTGQGAGPITVLVLGNPLYMDPKEPGFSMVDGYFPSDAHLTATRDKSVYGLESRGKALENIAVHFGYFGDPWVSEVHREKISRFWTLYLQGQGAQLVTFTGDLPTVFAATRNPLRTDTPSRHQIDSAQTKLEMLRITRDVGVADWITREDLDGATTPPSRTFGPMKIGIRWKGEIDLDLYARGARDSEMLFFEHTRSVEGYYFKDHRSSPDREYEFIEFESPVDVWKAEARINYYEGRSRSSPKGEIRIEFDGRIYTGEFEISAREGNEGRTGSRQRDFWSQVDIPGILKLR